MSQNRVVNVWRARHIASGEVHYLVGELVDAGYLQNGRVDEYSELRRVRNWSNAHMYARREWGYGKTGNAEKHLGEGYEPCDIGDGSCLPGRPIVEMMRAS